MEGPAARPHRRRIAAAMGVGGAVAVALALALARAPFELEVAAPPAADVPSAPVAALTAGPASRTEAPRPEAAGVAGAATAAPLPPGIDAAGWRRLEAEMAGRADGAAELARIRAFLLFSDDVRRLRTLNAAADAAGGRASLVPALHDEARILARRIVEALATHVQQREVTAAEAALLHAAAASWLEATPAALDARLAAWSTQQAERASDRAREAQPARDAEARFLAEQQRVVTAWQALPAATREPARLAAELDALRARHFGAPLSSPSPAPPHAPPTGGPR
jgi:hypothetical protein